MQARGAARLRSADIGAARRRLGPRFARARSRAMFPRFPAAAFHLPRLSFRRTRAVLSRSLRIDCIIAFFSLPVKPGTPLNRSGTAAKQVRNAPGKAVASYWPQPHACKINGRGSRADSLAARVYFVRWDTPDRPPYSRHGREYARQPNARKGVCSAAFSFIFTNPGVLLAPSS